MISTDGTVVYNDIPGPQCHRIPLTLPSASTNQELNDGTQPTFFTSNRFLSSDPASGVPVLEDFEVAFILAGAVEPDGASVI